MVKMREIFIVLSICGLLFLFLGHVSAGEYIVRGNSSTDYDDLNNWMETADDGSDVIFDIDRCDWELKVKKSLNFKSNKKTKFIGKWDGSSYNGPIAFNISAPRVSITGFYFENYHCGILTDSNKTTIKNNEFQKNQYGFYAFAPKISSFTYYNISDITISNNSFINNIKNGCYFMGDNITNIIISNNIASNNGGNGIAFHSGMIIDKIQILNNILNYNTEHGLSLYSNVGNNVLIANNTANYNSGFGMHLKIQNIENCKIIENTFNNNKRSGISLNTYPNMINNIISKNIAKNNGEGGIFIYSGGDGTHGFIIGNKISDNILINNSFGIYLEAQDGYRDDGRIGDNIIDGNTITNNRNGIAFNFRGICDNNTISNNLIYNNTCGINTSGHFYEHYYKGFNNNLIINNSIQNNDVGMHIRDGSNNTIMSNTILNNKLAIYFSKVYDILSENNTVIYNRIYNNTETLRVIGMTINANLNWWGTNNPKTDYENVTIDYWYVIGLSADEFKTIKNAIKNFKDRYSAILSYYLTTNKEINHDPNSLPYFLITLKGPNGEISNVDIRNINLTYYVEGAGKEFLIESMVDDENINLLVSFSENPKPPIPPVPPVPPIPPVPPVPPIDPDKNDTNKTNHPPTSNAAMKNTGTPIFSVFLLLLSSLIIVARRK